MVEPISPSNNDTQAGAQAGAIVAADDGRITPEWCRQLSRSLEAATWEGASACRRALPAAQLMRIFKQASDILKAEPTLLEIDPAALGGLPALVVGDTHGQYHDVLRLFETAGQPGTDRVYVFNGDFVDRGAWGVETLALLLAWKVALPRHVFLLRGNHESTYCTKYYGFQGELTAKYGPQSLKQGEAAAAAAAGEAAGEAAADEQQQHHQNGGGHEPHGGEQQHEGNGNGAVAHNGAGNGAAAHNGAGDACEQQQEQEQPPPHEQHEQQEQQHGAAGGRGHNLRPKRTPAPKPAPHAPAKAQAAGRCAKKDLADLIKASRRLFALLPLGALVARSALVLHGGLFRAPPAADLRGKKRRNAKSGPLQLGSLDDLRAASKGGQDPNGLGSSLVACDVLWSDPVMEEGLRENEPRGGVGCIFGPDVTEAFLSAHGLKLIIRSHEGPDARLMRDDLGPMDEGYTVDHTVPSGRLVTVFSAPDYPQFQAVGADEERTRNKAAVARLAAPGWDDPEFIQFEAALPRPKAEPYYDFTAATEAGSSSEDEEEGDEGASRARAGAAAGPSGADGRAEQEKGRGRRAASPAAAAANAGARAGGDEEGPPSKRLRHSHADHAPGDANGGAASGSPGSPRARGAHAAKGAQAAANGGEQEQQHAGGDTPGSPRAKQARGEQHTPAAAASPGGHAQHPPRPRSPPQSPRAAKAAKPTPNGDAAAAATPVAATAAAAGTPVAAAAGAGGGATASLMASPAPGTPVIQPGPATDG